jgi:hypothetical protein
VRFVASVSPGQRRSQVELLQLTEHAPVQVTWHVAPAPHETLPETPTVTLHSEASQDTEPLTPVVRLQTLPPRQLALQDPSQLPVQVLPLRQSKEQLLPVASQPVASLPTQVQVASASHEQVEPEHAQASPGQADARTGSSSPQAPVTSSTTGNQSFRVAVLLSGRTYVRIQALSRTAKRACKACRKDRASSLHLPQIGRAKGRTHFLNLPVRSPIFRSRRARRGRNVQEPSSLRAGMSRGDDDSAAGSALAGNPHARAPGSPAAATRQRLRRRRSPHRAG